MRGTEGSRVDLTTGPSSSSRTPPLLVWLLRLVSAHPPSSTLRGALLKPLLFPPHRKLLTEALPLLLDLDGQPVAERWTSDEEDTA